MRMKRLPYWGIVLGGWVSTLIVLYLVGDASDGSLAPWPVIALTWAFFVAVAAVILWAGSCRARDMGKSPHTTWMLLIPFANWIVLIWLGVAKSATREEGECVTVSFAKSK